MKARDGEKSLSHRVAVNASALAAVRVASSLIGVVSVGVSTRYLGVDAFGALTAAIAFQAVATTLNEIGLSTIGAREIAKRPEDTQRIAGTLITAGLGFSVLAGVVGLGIAFALYGRGGDELTWQAIPLLLLTLPLAAPSGAVSAVLVARQQAALAALGAVAGTVVTLAGVVIAAELDAGFTALVLAYVAAAVAHTAVMVALAAGKVRLRPSRDRALTTRLIRWALPLGAATIVHSLYWRIDLILLSLLSSDAQVALYGLAYRVVDALVALPGFVTITLLPEFSRLVQQPGRFEQAVEKGFRVFLVAAAAVIALFVAFASEIVEVVGGEDFQDSAHVLQILMIGVALIYLSSIFGHAFTAQNRQRELLWLSLVLLPSNVALNLLLIPAWGATGAAAAFAATELVHLTGIMLLYRRFGRVPRPKRWAGVLVAVAAVALVGLAKLLPPISHADPVLVLLVGGSAAAALYVATLYALGSMPPELHRQFVLPLWRRLRPKPMVD